MKLSWNLWSHPGSWLGTALITALAGALLVLSASSNAQTEPRHERRDADVMLLFQTMYAVDGPFVGSRAIRGVEGDELPWTLDTVQGYLTTGGRLHIIVRGLVFTDDDEVPK